MPKKIKLLPGDYLIIETGEYGDIHTYFSTEPRDVPEVRVILEAKPQGVNIHFGAQSDPKFQQLFLRHEIRKRPTPKQKKQDAAFTRPTRDGSVDDVAPEGGFVSIKADDIKPFPPVGYNAGEEVIAEVLGYWDSNGLRMYRLKPERGAIFIYRSDRPHKVLI